MFALFYSEYPRHEARKVAHRAWCKIDPDAGQFAAIMDALALQKRVKWRGKESQYIPHPATWLNQERWTDEIEEPHVHSEACREFGFCPVER
jgi:hypothetical protein